MNDIKRAAKRRNTSTWLAILLLFSLGCSRAEAPRDELAPVVGTVTLDGEPLEGAQVAFEPEQGAMSLGTTDESGKFELNYNSDFKGAVLGHHVVRISKIGGPDTEFDTMNLLPARYNEKSQLEATVSAGENVIDFPLKAK